MITKDTQSKGYNAQQTHMVEGLQCSQDQNTRQLSTHGSRNYITPDWIEYPQPSNTRFLNLGSWNTQYSFEATDFIRSFSRCLTLNCIQFTLPRG